MRERERYFIVIKSLNIIDIPKPFHQCLDFVIKIDLVLISGYKNPQRGNLVTVHVYQKELHGI